MSQEAEEILTLVETTQSFLRTRVASFFLDEFPTVLQVGLDAASRGQIILESVGLGDVFDEGTDELLIKATNTDETASTPVEPVEVPDLPEPQLEVEEPEPAPVMEPAAVAAVGAAAVVGAGAISIGSQGDDTEEEDVSDPDTLGDPEETEDLLREGGGNEAKTVADALGFEDDLDTNPGIEVEGPGEDALITIDDTSDPLSDLDDDLILDDIEDDETPIKKKSMDELEELDLFTDEEEHPDEEETFVADLADIERMKAKMAAERAPAPKPVAPRMKPPPPRMKPPPPARPRAQPRGVAAVAAGGVTAGLYGNPAVPTIRDRNAPKPAAAAIQIDDAQAAAATGAASSGTVLEEEEVLELGSSEDYGEEEVEGDGGLSINVHEYDDEEEEFEYEDEDEDDIELEEMVPEPPPPIDEGPDPAELKRLLQAAQAAVDSGKMEDAIDLYSDVLDFDPDNIDAFVARGRLYLDFSDHSRAMSDFMQAEGLDPTNPEPHIAVGDLHFARKEYNSAIDHFNNALQKSPNHAMAHCRRGISHFHRKNYTQALDDLTKAQKLDDDIPNIRTYIAMAKKKAKR